MSIELTIETKIEITPSFSFRVMREPNVVDDPRHDFYRGFAALHVNPTTDRYARRIGMLQGVRALDPFQGARFPGCTTNASVRGDPTPT